MSPRPAHPLPDGRFLVQSLLVTLNAIWLICLEVPGGIPEIGIGLVYGVPPLLVAYMGRERMFEFTAQRFDKQNAQSDGGLGSWGAGELGSWGAGELGSALVRLSTPPCHLDPLNEHSHDPLGAFIAELLSEGDLQVGDVYYIHRKTQDEAFPEYDPLRNWEVN